MGKAPASPEAPHLVLLMGVSGSGKTTLGRLLAKRLGYTFMDADDFHSAEAITRMRSGTPLGDDMRDAWVRRVAAALVELRQRGKHCVLAFSGLRARHRQHLMQLGFDTRAFLLGGNETLLAERIGQRSGHFMPAAQLQRQLATLEPVQADEAIEHVDIGAGPEAIAATLAEKLQR